MSADRADFFPFMRVGLGNRSSDSRQALIRPRIALGLCCLLASGLLYWATIPWPDTPDGWIHLHRVRALADALQMGVWLPRWLPDFSFGYGYPVFHFYAPAFYYPPALLTALGMDVLSATRITLACLYGVSGFGMGLLLLNFTTPLPALVGTVVYLTFPYRFYDLFVRGALPEFAAFVWLPLLVHFAYQACQNSLSPNADNRTINTSTHFATLALCWAALILTHNLTALMAVIVLLAGLPLLAWLVIFEQSTRSFIVAVHPTPPHPAYREGANLLPRARGRLGGSEWLRFIKRWSWTFYQLGWRLGLPIVFGALLSAWYWVPAILEAQWVGIGASENSAGYANHFATWASLGSWTLLYPYPSADAPTVTLPGWLLAAVGVAILLLGLKQRGQTRKDVLLVSIGVLLLTGWLTTAPSEPLWRLTALILGKLQFPWRWQVMMAPAAGVLIALLWTALQGAVTTMIRPRSRSTWGQPFGGPTGVGMVILGATVSVCFILYTVLGLRTVVRLNAPPDLSTAAMWALDAQYGQVGATWTGEFLPIWVREQRWAIGRAPSIHESAPARLTPPTAVAVERIGYDTATYRVSVQQRATVIIHQFYYPAWQVLVDGVPTATAPATDLGLLSFNLAPGEHQVEIAFGATAAIWWGRLLTGIGWGVLFLTMRQSRQRWRIIGWLIVGAVMVAVGCSLGAVTIQPSPTKLDYGAVHLIGGDMHAARPGQTAAVRLHWLVVAPAAPLTAFVHIVAADGRVVAQNDGPLAGDYTPVERWLPGLLLNHTHPIALPADLPPGKYQVLAGLYPAGQPQAPVLPVGATEPRAPIGLLEVLP